jgi:recombination protein RecR
MYPKSLEKLIQDFQKLPGIGEKTAERLALHMITTQSKEDILSFAKNLEDVTTTIHECPTCHMITDQPVCSICKDTERDPIVMVVAEAKDVISLEKMQTYKGYYHVLGNVIDFSRGISNEDLNIATLTSRLKTFNELIIATNSTVEGELTARYLHALFHESIMVTRLAYGLPMGTDFKYADSQTLAKAVENRKGF